MGLDSLASNKIWKKDETAALIALYESEQCLHNKTDKNYNDPAHRTTAYLKIRQVMHRIRPDCTILQIKNKIKCLRAQYATEKLRRDVSIRSNLCTEETYQPAMWCFGLLQFLDESMSPKIKIEIEEEENKESTVESEQCENLISNSQTNQNHIDDAGSSDAIDGISDSLDHLDDISDETSSRKRRKLSSTLPTSSKSLNVTENTPIQSRYDREDIFGQYVATEMKALKDNPLLYLQTKQAILEILTSANFELINPE